MVGKIGELSKPNNYFSQLLSVSNFCSNDLHCHIYRRKLRCRHYIISENLRRNLRKSAGKLYGALKWLKILKRFPQIFADCNADKRRWVWRWVQIKFRFQNSI